jgi:hypothetical protein
MKLREWVEKYLGKEFEPAVDSPAFPLILVLSLMLGVLA